MLSAWLHSLASSKQSDARGRSQNDFICAAKLDALFNL